MPRIAPDSPLELQQRFTARLAEQLKATREPRPADPAAALAERQDYLKQRSVALKAVEAARASALARFDADIARRRQQIAQLEAALKQQAEGVKEAKGAVKAVKPARPAKAAKEARGKG